ncbi:chemoreceptor glutamine deamidase CheD [bacterium BMS3Bbin06]|nr:chemoreceptor glutamine deamidase CheD [bacterium BMS3Abin08]GBE34549.1 chemoreceptor glutamine deamidase CheD [bacterium BMS3Bbin06]
MNPLKTKLPVVYLKPGEMYTAERPTMVSTVLGSCVSVTMFSRRLKIGAICHGFLPKCTNTKHCDSHYMEEFKYVDYSIMQMIEGFDKYGIKRSEIEVKLFGGADALSLQGDKPGTFTVGRQNIQTAIQVIKNERLHLIISDTGGLRGRKLIFYTHTGEVLLKRLKQGRFVKKPTLSRNLK